LGTDPIHERARTPASSTGDTIKTTDCTPLLIDAKTRCPMLGLGRRTVWSLTNCKALPSRRIGRARRCCLAEMRTWIDADCPTEPGSSERVRDASGKGVPDAD
jgi:predicted DNA-binding transcriptional regulator AlpA